MGEQENARIGERREVVVPVEYVGVNLDDPTDWITFIANRNAGLAKVSELLRRGYKIVDRCTDRIDETVFVRVSLSRDKKKWRYMA